ncbi:uncharacterized protein DNG_03140 [Cephalotrichum gorgonifer]|uniref:Uncharacterized protein n=1 Tax=Cephalotrichum gorgonifer TaxID=2041049 RepID=A0AAE8MUR0_9PEZI|nr:uncharacterized protein DNG_03140 [Cephalotrichum gorgonifer]
MRLLQAILIVVQGVASVQCAHKWTLAKSCYEDKDLRKAMITAMETVKERSANGAKQLKRLKSGNPITLFGKLKAVTKLLLGSDTYKQNAESALKRFELVAQLDGPINDNEETFADSPAWKALQSNNDHFMDFVIHCGTDIISRNIQGSLYYWDKQRDQQLGDNHELIKMEREVKAGKWDDPRHQILAVTLVDNVYDRPQRGGRRNFAEKITFHPLYLKDQKDRQYDLFTEEKLQVVTRPDALQTFREKGKLLPIDLLHGLDGTLHHELFHLSGFGNLVDGPDQESAYGWANNTLIRNIDNPDLLSYLGLVIDLVENKKHTVEESGKVVKI